MHRSKETLAAAMIAATGWNPHGPDPQPLYDPCCGSGTVVIRGRADSPASIPAGILRRFGWKAGAIPAPCVGANSWMRPRPKSSMKALCRFFGSDVSHRMVDFAQRNAERAGVAETVNLRGGDALQRMPPCEQPGMMLLNPRTASALPLPAALAAMPQSAWTRSSAWAAKQRKPKTVASSSASWPLTGRSTQRLEWLDAHARFEAAGKMRLKESPRTPMWNGPIECRLLLLEMIKGAVKPRKDESDQRPSDKG